MSRYAAILCLLLIAYRSEARPASAGPDHEPIGPWREQTHGVPVRDASGTHFLHTRVCRPARETPARVVLINHGSPPDARDRPSMRPISCESEAAQWFLTRGYIVVAGMRRGYGETGGDWAERFDPACSAEGYAHGGLESARDLDALVTYATSLPYAQRNGAVVVGQSAGGWATVAYDSLPHPHVAAMVSMAGGRGGHRDGVPGRICRSEELVRAAGRFGATAGTPMLWVYTANDSFFAPHVVTALHAAFTRSGGRAELIQTGPFSNDGHRLFFGKGGSAIWGPMIERYLVSRGVAP